MLLRTLLRSTPLDSMERAEARKCSEYIWLETERARADDKRRPLRDRRRPRKGRWGISNAKAATAA